MNQIQNVALDSCVVIDIIEKPKVARYSNEYSKTELRSIRCADRSNRAPGSGGGWAQESATSEAAPVESAPIKTRIGVLR